MEGKLRSFFVSVETLPKGAARPAKHENQDYRQEAAQLYEELAAIFHLDREDAEPQADDIRADLCELLQVRKLLDTLRELSLQR